MKLQWKEGPEFSIFQSRLELLGYTLPKFGADGQPGEETARAVEEFCSDHGVWLDDDGFDPKKDKEAWKWIVEAIEIMIAASPDSRRRVIIDDHRGGHIKGSRSWTKIDSIVLHQTAIDMGPGEGTWYELRAHIGVPRVGEVYYIVNPLNQLMWHANSLNSRSVGIEVSGNFPGLKSNPKTHWKPSKGYNPAKHGPHALAPGQGELTRAAIQYVVDEVARHGGKIRHIFAHRQSSRNRIGDPGEEIWKECGEWAIKNLGLTSGEPSTKFGSGYVLPDAWTGRTNSLNYW